MKIITIASPDKISLGMFTNFLSKVLGKNFHLLYCHSLMSPEAVEVFVNDSTTRFEQIVFRYYAKKKINKKPKNVIPSKILGVSDLVIWLDLYSVEPKIVKDEPKNFERLFSKKWNQFVESHN